MIKGRSLKWTQYLLQRMGYVKWNAMNKVKVSVKNFAEMKAEFLLEVKHVIAMDVISTELVINFDHIGLNIVPTLQWTIKTDKVEVVGKTIRNM